MEGQTSGTRAENATPDRVRSMMIGYLDRVAERLGYVRLGTQAELAERVRTALSSDLGDAIVEEVRLAVARDPEQFAANSEAELLSRLTDAFDQAIARVERKTRESAPYGDLSSDERDPDPAFRRGALRAASNRLN